MQQTHKPIEKSLEAELATRTDHRESVSNTTRSTKKQKTLKRFQVWECSLKKRVFREDQVPIFKYLKYCCTKDIRLVALQEVDPRLIGRS